MLVSLTEEETSCLAQLGCTVTSSPTFEYNCVAHSVEKCIDLPLEYSEFIRERRWWWPSQTYFWPPNTPREVTLEAFVQLYGSLGYEISSSGEVHEVGFQKVALYTRQSIPTHVSIQLKNGVWSSKLGVVEDLSHPSLETLSAFFNTFPQYRDLYGQVELIMAKPLSD